MKYKLIKTYPGSPELETILTPTLHTKMNSNEYILYNVIIKPIDYPEFWELQIERDYEILEYKTESGISCNAPFLEDSESFYKKERCSIYSIKRLSDNEIFTIGDKLETDEKQGYILLEKINIDNSYLWGHYKNNGNLYEFGIDLKFAKKIKQLLFTTEDGVDIYENDEHWFVYNDLSEIFKGNSKSHIHKEYIHKLKSFSLVEAAKEYVLMNKPCLSLNDILVDLQITSNKHLISKLNKLVESKINNK